MGRRQGPISVHCGDCHQDRRIDCTMCEVIIHPDQIARLSWTCHRCGPQLFRIKNPNTIGLLQDVGVPVADWSDIDPWMDRPRDWTPLTIAEVDGYINTTRDGARFDVALRALLEGQT